VSLSNVLRDTWSLYTRFFLRLVLTAAAVFAVLELLSTLASSAAGSHNWSAAVLWGLASFLSWLIGVFWIQGALIEAVQDLRDGRVDLPIGQLYARVRPLLPSLIAAGIAAACGIVFGLVLLIVPGLILMTRWILIVPVIVLEKKRAGEAFDRSWKLVKGSSWPVFWLILLTMCTLGLGSALVEALLFPLSFLGFLGAWIVGTITSSLVAPLAALSWTLAYFELAREQVRPSATMMPPIRV
jgi:tetrahydromethanopterin S-methyltransferase subunit F